MGNKRNTDPRVLCRSCGRKANIVCSCGCGATACYKCVREGKVG